MKPRLTIAWLLAVVACCGVGFAALVSPSQLWASMLFTLTLGALTFAAINVIYSRERARAFWVGFVLSGGVYFAAVFGPWTSADVSLKLGTTTLLDILYAQIAPQEPQPQPVTGSVAAVVSANGMEQRMRARMAEEMMMTMSGSGGTAGIAGGVIRGRPTTPSEPPPSRWSVWAKPDRTSRTVVGQIRLVSPEPFRRIGHSLLTLLFAGLAGLYAQFRHDRRTGLTDAP